MFQSLRWRMTLLFVTLSAFIYFMLTLSGMVLFKAGLTSALDDSLQALISEIGPAVDLRNDKPSLTEWANTSHTEPFHLTATVQLFDRDGKLLEAYGPPGISTLFKNRVVEIGGEHARRIMSDSLIVRKRLRGYLQIQLPTKNRDVATRQFGMTLSMIAPFVLLALGITGYLVAGKAAAPVEESFKVLRRFMADAGHELSTPLSIIQANAETLEHELEQQNIRADKVGVIERSTERMGALVTDLMLLSRMESPQPKPVNKPIELDKLVTVVVEDFQHLFESKHIALSHEVTPVIVMGQPDPLRRMLTNLLENALRYSEENSAVKVTLSVQGRNARLSVADTGIGIPPESLRLIFDRFYRVEKSRSRAAGGSGLGLSIVKAIVETHKGHIDVESQVGVGTKFTIVLPLKR